MVVSPPRPIKDRHNQMYPIVVVEINIKDKWNDGGLRHRPGHIYDIGNGENVGFSITKSLKEGPPILNSFTRNKKDSVSKRFGI